MLTWEDDDEDDEGELAWLVGGEEDDVEAFVDATGLDGPRPRRPRPGEDGHDHGDEHAGFDRGDAAG